MSLFLESYLSQQQSLSSLWCHVIKVYDKQSGSHICFFFGSLLVLVVLYFTF